MRDPRQLALWEVVQTGVGRPTARPWGVPKGAWDSYLREVRRGNHPSLADLVQRRGRRPVWVSPGDWTARERPETAPHRVVRTEQTIRFPEASTTLATRRMIERGLFRGVVWVPGVGGVEHRVVRWQK